MWAGVSLDAPSLLQGQCPGVRRALYLARRFAPTGLPLLILGETGTGKELLAREIHARSGRRREFVDVNCGALPPELIESTLFGHRRGSFSGAVEDAPGLVEAADGGTLFLDELGELSLAAQVKLLRVLETGEFRRVGETAKRRSAFRLVAASQEALDEQVASGAFRMDLYQRVATVVIRLPPLRERGRDLDLLAQAFAAAGGRTVRERGLAALRAHTWPGNVRELQAVIVRAGWLSHDSELAEATIAEALAMGIGPNGGTHERNGHPELDGLVDAARATGWRAQRTARALGISRTTLWRRLSAAGLTFQALKERCTSCS